MENEIQTNLAVGIKFTPALCVDLDGTVRRSKLGTTFINNFSDIELMPGIEKLLWIYRKMGWLIIGISNQGGVAHGHKLPMEIEHELDTTLKLFNQNPFHIVKMCMHMEGGNIEPFNHRSLCRKPDIGMLALAEQDAFLGGYVIDWNNSLFVGDRPEDEECAKNARIKFEHIDSFLVSPKEFTIGTPLAADVVDGRPPENLTEVVDVLMSRFEGMEKRKEFEQGEDSFASYCHSQLSGGIGMKIRNEFELWDGNSILHRYFKENHDLQHPDSMSDLIIRHVYRKMKPAVRSVVAPDSEKPDIQLVGELNLDFLKLHRGKVFATGLTTDRRLYKAQVRWVAKVGDGYPDWAICYHHANRSLEYIKTNGDKITTESIIRELVPCTDEAFANYRP